MGQVKHLSDDISRLQCLIDIRLQHIEDAQRDIAFFQEQMNQMELDAEVQDWRLQLSDTTLEHQLIRSRVSKLYATANLNDTLPRLQVRASTIENGMAFWHQVCSFSLGLLLVAVIGGLLISPALD
ncbi:hypothetical protein DM01DRAFT_323780 [Hesseltinella vesiculosa]|uniref:Uncharacterized protein n=1 Tax=Hesseltinella vesiculosa TaxID=101127 RepID=A0A1X2GBX0_9FUNG|nr:hypothetical protein DM01DRAFT_323780 [Hesseltinella vesiculosa]